MKKIISSICLLLMLSTAIAQTMPSQADMDKMMKQVQDAMKDLPPEAKQMMDSMGIKMPDSKQMSLPKGMTMNSIQQKMDQMKADAAAYRKKALAEMPRKVFTDAELATFLKTSFDKIDKKVTPKAKENAQKIIAQSKTKNVSVENSAALVFINRGSQEALWILSKLAVEDPKNSNLLCNYSAVVTMCGAPDMAIPVLNNLNIKYPNNSSVLNNLGQAWYELEKADSAEKYLKLAIKASPHHVNANHTESMICGSNGDISGKIICLRDALKGGYTEKIAAELKKSGVKLTRKDVTWPFPYNPDPLGFKNIEIPDYPTSAAASDELKPKWDAFKSKCKAEAAAYEAQAKKLGDAATKKEQELFANAIKTKNLGAFALPFAELAGIYFGKDIDDAVTITKKWGKDLVEFGEDKIRLEKIASEKSMQLDEEMEKKYKGRCPGEGCPYSEYCPDFSAKTNQISNAYLSVINPKHESVINEELEMLRLSQGAAVNIAVFASTTDERLEYQKAISKAAYLGALADINYEFISSISSNECSAPNNKPSGEVKLSDFDEVTCPVENKFNFAFGFGKIAFSCTKVSIEGGAIVQGSFESDLRTGNTEFGIGLGVSWHSPPGPINAEGSFKVMGIYQFDGNGNYTGGGIKVNPGAQFNAGALNAEVEHSTTYFINTDSASPGLNVGGLDFSAGVKN